MPYWRNQAQAGLESSPRKAARLRDMVSPSISRVMKTRRELRSASGQAGSSTGGMEEMLDPVDGDRPGRLGDIEHALDAQQIGAVERDHHLDPIGEFIPVQGRRPGQAEGADMLVMAVAVEGSMTVSLVMSLLMVMPRRMIVMVVGRRGIGLLLQPAAHVEALAGGIVEAGVEQAMGVDPAGDAPSGSVPPGSGRAAAPPAPWYPAPDRIWSARDGRRPRPASRIRSGGRAGPCR